MELLALPGKIAGDVGAELFGWLRPDERRQQVDLLDRVVERATR